MTPYVAREDRYTPTPISSIPFSLSSFYLKHHVCPRHATIMGKYYEPLHQICSDNHRSVTGVDCIEGRYGYIQCCGIFWCS